MTLFVVAAIVAWIIKSLANKAVEQSDVWKTFAANVFHIEFDEINLDVISTGIVVGNMANHALFTSVAGYIVALAVWANGIKY